MRITFLAAVAVVLALPATASAKVGDVVGGGSKPWVVIAEGKYPNRGHTKGRPWFVVARACGDDKAEHAQYQLFVGKASQISPRFPCVSVGAAQWTHVIGWGASPGIKKSRFPRTIQYGGVAPNVDALKVIVKNRWVTTPLLSLPDEPTAAAGFEPVVKFYVRDSPPERTFRTIPNFGVAAYSGGKLVDCIGRDCDSGGGT
jgi:hypothetical protein